MDTIESQKQKYINKQKLYLHKWSNGLIHNIPRHRVYEHLWALKLGHLMWDDLPPDFGVRFKLPSKRDCGVDTVSWEYNQTGQIKLYSKGSRIAFGDMSNFYTYSTLNLGIDDMCVGTTPEAEFTVQAKHVCTKSSMCIKRQSFDELLAEAMSGFDITSVLHTSQCEKRSTDIELREYLVRAHQVISNSNKRLLKLQLPCGTGKSYIMLYTMLECLKTKPSAKFCVFCPWIDLAKQLRDLLSAHLHVLFIGGGKQERTPAGSQQHQVVVCVNGSAHHIPEDDHYEKNFYDEAHHLRDENAAVRSRLDKVPCAQTVMLSATFHESEDLDYDFSMREAIDGGYISDYVLHLEFFSSGDRTCGLRRMLVEHSEWFPMFVYFNSTKRCIECSKYLQSQGVVCDHLVGADGAEKRRLIRYQLETGKLNVLCLCGCYNEGISIDNIQTVVFGDLRHSQINKIQIAMRANRKHPTKPFSRIVWPLVQKDLDNKDVRELVQSFARIDSAVHEVFRNKDRQSSRIRVHISQDANTTPLSEPQAEFLYEQIYGRCCNLVGGWGFEEQFDMFKKYVVENNDVPSKNKKLDNGWAIGEWYNITQKGKIKSKEDGLYKQLADVHKVVRANLNELLQKRQENYSDEEKFDMFKKYVTENNDVPPQSKKLDNEWAIGTWYNDQKGKIKSKEDGLYKQLADVHKVVRASLNELLQKRQENEHKEDYSDEEKFDMFKKYVTENNDVPSQKEKLDNGWAIGTWYTTQKSKIKSKEDGLYKQLADVHKVVRANLDELLQKRQENEHKEDYSDEEKFDMFKKYVVENKKVPSKNKKLDNGWAIGAWYNRQKGKIKSKEDGLYKQFADVHKVVRANLDELLQKRQENEHKEDYSDEEKFDMFKKYVTENNDVPPQSKKLDNGWAIGKWYNTQKGKIKSKEDGLYKQLADVHKVVRVSLDALLQKRQKRKTNNSK